MDMANIQLQSKHLTKFLSIDSKNPEALIGKGKILINLSRYTEAKHYFDVTISVDPNNGAGWYLRGIVLENLGQALEAKNDKDKALKINPHYSGEYVNKVLYLVISKNPKKTSMVQHLGFTV